ncbi:MFS transporter [Terrarubrum flagellatum]|uniref:MFS transporter n=1 Tax=Terrirubrum flagellatum TaxID=2895980 RepID=UPI00314543B9
MVWITPLLVTLLLQIVSAVLSRLIPFLAPVLTSEAGIPPTVIGYFAAANMIGSILFLSAGTPLLRRAGPVRTLQIGVFAGGLGVLLIAWPTAATLLAASFLCGLGYGPSPAAGGEILQRHAPPRHRALIFSIKQAGVPIGGVLGGLVLPLLAANDWRHALYACTALAFIAILIVQPSRETIDKLRDPSQILSLSAFLSLSNLTAPLRSLARSPGILPVTGAAFCFACAQGVLFAFFTTYLVVELGFTLTAAGALFATNQIASVFGRIFLGWIVDRAGGATSTLIGLGVASAATTAAIALISPSWSPLAIAALAAVSGVTVVSWNGVILAETARLAPPDAVAQTAAGSTLLCFVGYVVSPASFAAIVQASGSYRLAFLITACVALGAAFCMISVARKSRDASR